MKATLLLVGRTTDKNFIQLIDGYCERLNHYMPFAIQVLPELKGTKNISADEQKQREGEMILRALAPQDNVVLLDERGSEYTSVQFAQCVQNYINRGLKNTVFVVGGPYGFSQAVYARANDKVSLSRMTFSHQMVRLVFVEQLYRAMTILKGEPYHHE